MSANTEDPESTIPWPGFVDILSTVIIVFVFFMMLTSVIIFVLSQEEKGKAVEAAKSEATIEAASMTEDEKSTHISQVLLENKALKEEVAKLLQIKSVLSESELQTTVRDTDGASLKYSDFGVTLQPKTIEFIKSLLPIKGKVMLNAIVPSGSNFGSTREIALNRALNVRNILLQEGVKPENIGLKITSNDTSEQTKNESDIYGGVIITFSQ